MKTIAVLAVLVLSLISVSSAAGLRATPDLFKGQCGVELSVPAPGILNNDVRSSGQLQVFNSEKISIDPKYGTLTVNEDGSFVYDAALNIAQGTYVTFYYKATDGSKKTSTALVKIQISCVCRGIAPDVTVCPSTKITSNFLISEGARCTGCRDMTPKFDLRKIPAHPVAGTCYPYTASCSGCGLVTGHVCFDGITPPLVFPIMDCPAELPTPGQVIALSGLSCGCGPKPKITDIHWISQPQDDVWTGEYTYTCTSADGSTSSGVGQFETAMMDCN
jgi:VCBS repeat-containing protein